MPELKPFREIPPSELPKKLPETEFKLPKSKGTKIESKEKGFDWKGFALDTGLIIASVFLPESLIITGPARLLRAGKYADYILSGLNKLSKYPGVKTFIGSAIQEAKTVGVLWTGEKVASKFMDIKVQDPVETFLTFYIGRGFFSAFGSALRAGYLTKKHADFINQIVGEKIPLSKKVKPLVDTFYKTFTGRPPDAFHFFNSIGSFNTQLMSKSVQDIITRAFENPEVRKEFIEYSNDLMVKLIEAHKNNPKLKIHETAPKLIERFWKDDIGRGFLYKIFIEKVHHPGTSYKTTHEEIWGILKILYKDAPEKHKIWEEAKNAFVENNKLLVTSELEKLHRQFRIVKELTEPKLLEKGKNFLTTVLDLKEISRSTRSSILGYLLRPLLQEKKGNFIEFLRDFGVKIVKKDLEKINKAFEMGEYFGLSTLGKIIVNKATTLAPIRNKLMRLWGGDFSEFLAYRAKVEEPIIKEFFDNFYIPRVGIYHPLRKLAIEEYEKPVKNVLETEILEFIQNELPLYITVYTPLKAMKPRTVATLEDALIRGIGILAKDIKTTDPDKIADYLYKNFRATGGMTVFDWITNKFFIPIYLNRLYYKLDELVRNPKFMEVLSDFNVKPVTYSQWGKTWEITTGVQEAIRDYYYIHTGRMGLLTMKGKLYPINWTLKRLFLLFSPFFHAASLTLNALSMNMQPLAKGKILLYSLIDAFKAVARGYDKKEHAYMTAKVYETMEALRKKGYAIPDLIVSGYYEGEKAFAEYLGIMAHHLKEMAKKGDLKELANVIKELEKFDPKMVKNQIWNIIRAPERWLWSGYYQGLKIRTAYQLIREFEKGIISEAELAKSLKSINNIFGGWHGWHFIHPNWGKTYRLLFFAPDWYLCLFNNFRTWITKESPLVHNFYPMLLRMRFYIASNLMYAITGKHPLDDLDLTNPKDWVSLFFEKWLDLFKIRLPIMDQSGHLRFLTIDIAGPEIEPLEMLGILQFMKNFYKIIERPGATIDQRISALVFNLPIATGKEVLKYWFRKASMIARILFKLHDSLVREKPEEKLFYDPTEPISSFIQTFAPLIFLQWFGLRYPYYMTPETKNIARFGQFLTAFSIKIWAHETLTDIIFKYRHNESFLSDYLPKWFEDYNKIKKAELKREFLKRFIPAEEGFVKSLGHRYFKEYFDPWIIKHKDKTLSEIKEEGKKLKVEIIEDIEKTGLPIDLKKKLIRFIHNNYDREITKRYKVLNKEKVREEIEKTLKEEEVE
jgi:hypothetical protein